MAGLSLFSVYRHRRSFEYAVFLPGSADISDSNVQTSYLYALYANLCRIRVTEFSNGTAIDCNRNVKIVSQLRDKNSSRSLGGKYYGNYAHSRTTRDHEATSIEDGGTVDFGYV